MHYSRYSSPIIPIHVGSEPHQEFFQVSSAEEIKFVVLFHKPCQAHFTIGPQKRSAEV